MGWAEHLEQHDVRGGWALMIVLEMIVLIMLKLREVALRHVQGPIRAVAAKAFAALLGTDRIVVQTVKLERHSFEGWSELHRDGCGQRGLQCVACLRVVTEPFERESSHPGGPGGHGNLSEALR